jgi:alkylation response protein AidB-like acyl-CoA dehydrogenase
VAEKPGGAAVRDQSARRRIRVSTSSLTNAARAGSAGAPSASRIDSEEQAIAVAREYAAGIAEGAIARDRSGAVARRELAAFDCSGLLGITVPRSHGGAEVAPRTLSEVIRTIAAVDPAIAQVPQSHFLFVDVLRASGSAEQQRRLFESVLDGGRLGNALAERGGQHAQDLRVRLLAGPGGELLLSGRKYYCTGAITSRWIAVTALSDADQRLKAVFVARDAVGVEVDEDWSAMGQRATVSGSAVFDGVVVDPELVIDYQGVFEDPHMMLRYGRLATQVRAAQALLEWAGDTLAEVGLAPADAQAAARGSLAVAQAKAFASEVAVLVASDLFALTGTSGADARHDLDRHWRNARTHSVHDPGDWKYRHVAGFELEGTLPPSHGQL